MVAVKVSHWTIQCPCSNTQNALLFGQHVLSDLHANAVSVILLLDVLHHPGLNSDLHREEKTETCASSV